MNVDAEEIAAQSVSRQKTAIPWDKTATSSRATLGLVTDLCRLFDASSTMQLAYATLVGELLHSRLVWKDATGAVIKETEVPTGWDQVVADCIRGILVAGTCFYRRGKTTPVEVAHPSVTYFNRRWTALVFYAPFPAAYAHNRIINSPVFRAKEFELRLQEHGRLHANRDRTNSRPAAFLSIDKRIQSESRSKPWFRTVGSTTTNSTLSGSLEPLNEDLDHLVEDRANVIAELSSHTVQTRKQGLQQTRAERDVPFQSSYYDASGKCHTEHLITDGYESIVAPQLQSLVDSRAEKTDLENNILYAMGVSPAVVGRNVNSERLSSANQLVMYSLHTYKTLIDRLKRAIGGLLKEMSIGTLPSNAGAFVSFPISVNQHQLEQILPHLTSQAAKDVFAATHNIPKEWVDKQTFINHSVVDASSGQPPAKKSRLDQQLSRTKKPPLNAADNVPT